MYIRLHTERALVHVGGSELTCFDYPLDKR